jgi:hypothetical protein
MQGVELGERNAPALHLLHGGLVFAAPGIREGEPIQRMPERCQDALALAGDAGAPIDEGAEDVEEQGFDVVRHAIKVDEKSASRKRCAA